MLINVTIEHREPDHRALQVLIEANDIQEAAEKIIDIAKSMKPKYNYRTVNDTTWNGKEYLFIYADETSVDDNGYIPSFQVAVIPKQEESSIENIKEALYTTELFY